LLYPAVSNVKEPPMYRKLSTLAAAVLSLSLGGMGCYTVEELTGTSAATAEGEYVVGFDASATELDLRQMAERTGLELVTTRGSDRTAVLVDPRGRSSEEVLRALGSSQHTEWAEPQYVYDLLHVPDDIGEYLWALDNTGVAGGRPGADIGAFDAWDRSTGSGIVIAVIDTGIDADHPDLTPNLWSNPGEIGGNGIDDDGNGYVDDVHGYDFVFRDGDPDDRAGHGTHVAGIAAARGDDGYGLVGTAYDARIMALKLLDPAGGGYSSMAAEAINYAVNNGADVINASWGGYGSSTAVRNAIAYARSRGVLFIAAAGNQGYDNDDYPMYPATYDLDNILSVAASDRRDNLASFSNTGARTVHLAAPGSEIVSTWRGGDWVYLDGTSMAAPFVAGGVALLQSAASEASYIQIRESLLATVEPLGSGGDLIATQGRMDAAGALEWLLEDDEPPAPAGPGDWSFVPHVIESSHPYENHTSWSWSIQAPEGATEMRLHFERVDLESGYDFLSLRGESGDKLAEWTGDQGSVVSATHPGSRLQLSLFTDYSVTQWGFRLSGYSWR